VKKHNTMLLIIEEKKRNMSMIREHENTPTKVKGKFQHE
jgi:hypothetical protein